MVRPWMVLCLLGSLILPALPTLVEAASPDDFIAEATERSAELAALREQIRGAQAMTAPAAALPDPMASVGLRNIPSGDGISLDQDMMSSVEVMLSQDVPASSKRRLRRSVREAEVAMLQARYQDKRLEIAQDVKHACIDLQYLDESLAIAEQNKQLASAILAAAEASYAAGKVMQQDVFQAQVQLSRMVDMLTSLRRQRAAAETRLNALLYRPARQTIPTFDPLAATAVSLDSEALSNRAEAQSPMLAEMDARLLLSGRARDLAAQGIRPDYRLSFAYMVRQPIEGNPMSGADMWSASVGINLPWLYRRQTVDREVEAAHAMYAASQQEREVTRNKVTSRVAEMVIEALRSEEQLSLVETGLLPQAAGALAASHAGYSSGKGDITSLLNDHMNIYNLQRQRIMLIAEHERDLATLDYLVGQPLAPAQTAGEVPAGGD